LPVSRPSPAYKLSPKAETRPTAGNSMASATKFRDRPHARIYAHWKRLPAWSSLSLAARCVLLEILMDYRPGNNGRLAWACRKAGRAVGISKDRAARALSELEMRGWITCERVAGFGRRNVPAEYALAMFPNDVTGDPASFAFEIWKPEGVFQGPIRVALEGHDGRISKTQRSQSKDAKPFTAAPIHLSDSLKSSRVFNTLGGKSRMGAKA